MQQPRAMEPAMYSMDVEGSLGEWPVAMMFAVRRSWMYRNGPMAAPQRGTEGTKARDERMTRSVAVEQPALSLTVGNRRGTKRPRRTAELVAQRTWSAKA
eukprot:7381160-Prymnesium_polylepis.1